MSGLRSSAELFRIVVRELLNRTFFDLRIVSQVLLIVIKEQVTRLHPTQIFFLSSLQLLTVTKSGPDNLLFLLFFIAIAIGIILVLIMNTTIPGSGKGTGTRSGKVTIGPLCPVEPCTVAPDQIAMAFAARTIVVSDRSGSVVPEAVPDQ